MSRTFGQLAESPGGLVSVDPLTDSAWGDLLARAPASSIFHDPAWLRLIHEHYDLSVSAWCVADGSGRLLGGIPVALLDSRLTGARLIALPFSDACPPLLDPSAGGEMARLATGVADAQRQIDLPLEVRGALPGSADGNLVDRYVEHRLPLHADVDEVVRGFTKSHVVRGMKKARREGVTIERRTDRDGLARFYRLHTATRRYQGVPTQSWRFIQGFSALFDAGLGFVLLARHDGRDIAAAVFFSASNTLTYKFGASNRRFLSLRPNNLLFMEAIQWGCENNQHTLDFGRTDYDNTGLREFKTTWGATESPLEFTYFGKFDKALGDGLIRRAMSVTIRHAPPSFSRLIGGTLYRHFG
ncbi:MAG TPA: GNAT family N-acetyltransferase [Solirubrobacteraceae bacterium]|nr:GNAT family N-acetyltransferase [Solirubrobacteraceae bacterium]